MCLTIKGPKCNFSGRPSKCRRAMCRMRCENGFQTGSDGCEICKCKQGISFKLPL